MSSGSAEVYRQIPVGQALGLAEGPPQRTALPHIALEYLPDF
jgi:hypothetical protein